MEQIIKGLYLGSDDDVSKSEERGYSRLACCKYGPDGHKAMLGYTTQAAPKGPEYLSAQRGDVMALNILDLDDPDLIPDKVIDDGLNFIKKEMDAGKKVFVHCNQGKSRSPSIVLMFLRAIGEMPTPFVRSEHIFRTLYPDYDPGVGMRAHSRMRWDSLPSFFKE
jgi:hypothetical protein